MGCGSGMTCWRRLRDWQEAGIWQAFHHMLLGRRRRWTDEEKARIVAESLDPGTTASAVARRYGLHVSQLFTWRQQLQRSTPSAAAIGGPAFVPVLLAGG